MINDMTMCEVLGDPLIRQLRRADGVSLVAFADLLQSAANRRDGAALPDQSAPFDAHRPAAAAVCPPSH